jgi:hypothetical protein
MAAIDPDSSSYLNSAADRQAHDQEVMTLINATIETHSRLYKLYTVGQILSACHAALTEQRDDDVMNTVVRDAEYYFVAREAVASHKWKAAKNFSVAYQDMRALWYDSFKEMFGGSGVLRTSSKPNSPAGGSRWALQGSEDGQLDDPNAVAKPRFCTTTPAAEEDQGAPGPQF